MGVPKGPGSTIHMFHKHFIASNKKGLHFFSQFTHVCRLASVCSQGTGTQRPTGAVGTPPPRLSCPSLTYTKASTKARRELQSCQGGQPRSSLQSHRSMRIQGPGTVQRPLLLLYSGLLLRGDVMGALASLLTGHSTVAVPLPLM